MSRTYWRDLTNQFHADNDHWWRDPATGRRIERDKLQLLFLINSEISEAGEGERKNLMDDHIPHRKMAEVEMADVVIRLADYIGAFQYDIDTAILRAFPKLPYHHNTLIELPRFFTQRFFTIGGNRARQLMQMQMAVAKIADLEDGGCAARDVESQLLWLIMLICDYCGTHGYDLWSAICEKRAYNAKRADHSNAARLAAGGKKW